MVFLIVLLLALITAGYIYNNHWLTLTEILKIITLYYCLYLFTFWVIYSSYIAIKYIMF